MSNPALTLRGIGPSEDARFVIEAGKSGVVGRADGVDLRIADLRVSSRHARLYEHSGQWFVEDLQSKPGTYVNGRLTRGPQPIHSGDVIRFGGVQFQAEVHETA